MVFTSTSNTMINTPSLFFPCFSELTHSNSDMTTNKIRDETTPLSLPVSYRFHPTEEELVNHYLKRKIQAGNDSEINQSIPEINLCDYEPTELPGLLGTETEADDMEWFFFTKKNNKSSRSNRSPKKGFWKITGKVRRIKARGSETVIGKKRNLTFYEGHGPEAKRTSWVIHEYYIPRNEVTTEGDFVICRLKNISAGNSSTEQVNVDTTAARASDQDSIHILRARIKTIEFPNGWYYMPCKSCSEELREPSRCVLLNCEDHRDQIRIPTYCLELCLDVDGGSIEVTLMGRPADALFGTPCETLVIEEGYDDPQSLPQLLADRILKQYLWEIEFGGGCKPMVKAVYADYDKSCGKVSHRDVTPEEKSMPKNNTIAQIKQIHHGKETNSG